MTPSDNTAHLINIVVYEIGWPDKCRGRRRLILWLSWASSLPGDSNIQDSARVCNSAGVN